MDTCAEDLPASPCRGLPVGRYAPSPTGRLHLGNLRTALLAHDDIRQRGGHFILRMEDTDTPRNVEGADEGILDDLRWLGLRWDEGPIRQSDRGALYEAALRRLARASAIYPCTCSRKDLQSGASAPHGPDGPVYPGTCRACGKVAVGDDPDEFLTNFLAVPWQARGASLRFRVDSVPVAEFTDEIHGRFSVDMERDHGDFVVLRRDGLWAYQFVCAVDDALMGVTRVVRGEDLLSSTPRQVAIIKALGFTPPVYRHVPLMTDDRGHRLSKRDGSASLDGLRNAGLSPAEVRQRLLSF